MIFGDILADVRSGIVQNFNPEENSVALITEYSRGPKPNGCLISIKATLKDRILAPTTQPHVIFVVDQSGSMQGLNFHAAVNVLRTVYDAVSLSTHISIIFFNDETQTLSIPLVSGTTAIRALKSQIDKDALDHILNTKRPGGNTNIIGALKSTVAVISQGGEAKPTQAQIDDTSIIFITDGQDNRVSLYTSGLEATSSMAPVIGGLAGSALGKPSTDVMIKTLKKEMEKDYGVRHFPRIMPIGIGLGYDASFVMSIGDDPDFHRTGFLHIASPGEVVTQRAALTLTVDPVRIKTQLFVAYKDGTHQLYPDIYLQRGVHASKEYLLDSSQISEIYLVQEHNAMHHEITKIISYTPPTDSLAYSDEILKRFLIVENAGITNSYSKCDDRTRLPLFLEKISTLLSNYPKAYWGKEASCLEAIENLSRLFIKISDEIAARSSERVISALEAQSFFHHDVNSRDALLRMASDCSQTTSCALSPGGMDLSPDPIFSQRY